MQSEGAALMKFFNERRVHTVHKGVVRRSVWETGQQQRVSNLCGIARSLEWLPLHELPN
jgi:hypothetical protein